MNNQPKVITKTRFNAHKLLVELNISEEEVNENEIACALYNLGEKKSLALLNRCITRNYHKN